MTERARAPAWQGWDARMLQKLSEEIQECYSHADQCRQRAEKAFAEKARQEFLDMEQRWLSLARSYAFAEQLSNYVEPFRNRNRKLPSLDANPASGKA